MNNLLLKAKTLPQRPGCYLMKNKNGQVIYVGKAKDLIKRVTSYFLETSKDIKTEFLIRNITDFDFIITENEAEALILENNLIKKHRPKYNIRLKDSKSYPYVVVDWSLEYPRLLYQRNVKKKKKQTVFGPFVTGSNISEIVNIINQSLRLRSCNNFEFKMRKQPCLLYQMQRCCAPCCNKIEPKEYGELVEIAMDLFKGNGRKIRKFLMEQMSKRSDSEAFEQAALIRDYLLKIEEFLKQNVVQNVEMHEENKNADVISYVKGEKETDIVIHMMRNSLLLGSRGLYFSNNFLIKEEDFEGCLLGLLYEYYETQVGQFPELIILSFDHTGIDIFKQALKKIFKKEKLDVFFNKPKYASLIKLATNQARENQKLRLSNAGSEYVGLMKLAEILNLFEIPRTLECFDVAIWQGKSPTASQIVFHDGLPDKSMYRHYKLEEKPEGNNDFAMMRELITRRIKHGNLPDVFVVDGGQGQIRQFIEVLKENQSAIPVIGIAKERSNKDVQERLIIPGRKNYFLLNKSRELMKILVNMRDEAHRFSRILHHKHEAQRIITSWFDDIEGVGPKTKASILKNLDKPIEELKEYSKEELARYLKVNQTVAFNILKKLI